MLSLTLLLVLMFFFSVLFNVVVSFNPEVILRHFYRIGVNYSENAIFKNSSKIAFKEK